MHILILAFVIFFFQWRFIIVQLEVLIVLSALGEKILVISAFGARSLLVAD